MRTEPNARLMLDFARKSDGTTYISSQYYNLPLQIMRPFYTDGDGSAFLYLLNPSGGMLDDDLFELKFTLGEDASALIATPAANKIYKTPKEAARQNLKIEMGKNTVLEYLPKHNIPFASSKYIQTTDFNMDSSSTLFTWDTLSCGRAARGEVFDYTLYKSILNFYVDGKLLLRDKMEISPDECKLGALGMLENGKILSSCFVYKQNSADNVCPLLKEYFSGSESVTGGATALSDSFTVIRLTAEKISDMESALADIWRMFRKNILGKDIFKI